MSETDTKTLPLLPLTNGVVLPQMVVPLALESDAARAAADASASSDGLLVLVPRLESDGALLRYSRVGTVAKVEEGGHLPNGMRAVLVRGLHRALVGSEVPTSGSALLVNVEAVTDPEGPVSERSVEAAREYRAAVEGILEHRRAPVLAEALRGITDPGALADSAGYSPDLSFERKVELLETIDVEARLEKVLGWAKETLGELELRERIRSEVSEGMERRQREFLLRQQLEAIRKELGDTEIGDAADYRARLEALDAPTPVREAVTREIDRLERTSEQSPERGWIRTWLDCLTELPWGQRSEDRVGLAAARAILDDDHTGLVDVKERIIEHLAVRRLRHQRGLDLAAPTRPDSSGAAPGRRGSGAILALVGPPGVGKTSLGESVARALGRRFVRIALGGVRDEAEIRGHRRTYIGSLPGRVIQSLRRAG
ncbi:MAG: LON peptidase substrate-binding domain-containing protein, partial [Acidimicrobiia bacterium]